MKEVDIRKLYLMFLTSMEEHPDSIYYKDAGGRFEWVNKAKALNSDTTPENMIGKTDFDFMSPEETRSSWGDDKRVMETEEPIRDRIKKRTRMVGSEVWVSDRKFLGEMRAEKLSGQWEYLEMLPGE